MVVRDFHCPQCMSSFKTESGMKWHLTHKHDLPTAIDAINKDYKSKLEEAHQYGAQLKEELERVKRLLEMTQMTLASSLNMNKELSTANQQFNDIIFQLTLAVSFFRLEAKTKYGIELSDVIGDCLRECQAKLKGCSISQMSTGKENQKEAASPGEQHQ